MVRGLTGTMLQAGRGKISVDEIRNIILAGDCSRADFSVPSQGLFLVKVDYPESVLHQLI
jgi:tRNA pseudouridine38-40 synthase